VSGYPNKRVNDAVYSQATTGFTQRDWIDLTLAALDQANISVSIQERIEALLPETEALPVDDDPGHTIELSPAQDDLWCDASEHGEECCRSVRKQAAAMAAEIGRTVEIMGEGGIVLDAVGCDRGDA
jgi:hypothetical protein